MKIKQTSAKFYKDIISKYGMENTKYHQPLYVLMGSKPEREGPLTVHIHGTIEQAVNQMTEALREVVEGSEKYTIKSDPLYKRLIQVKNLMKKHRPGWVKPKEWKGRVESYIDAKIKMLETTPKSEEEFINLKEQYSKLEKATDEAFITFFQHAWL